VSELKTVAVSSDGQASPQSCLAIDNVMYRIVNPVDGHCRTSCVEESYRSKPSRGFPEPSADSDGIVVTLVGGVDKGAGAVTEAWRQLTHV